MPNPIYVHPVNPNETIVYFGVIADTHIDASYAGWVPGHDHQYRDTWHVIRNRRTIQGLNDHLYDNCHGIVHLGDMVDANNTQNLIAFRQLYENDYPGMDGGSIYGAFDTDYNAYSCGYRVHKPVFPTIGNHDCPPYGDSPTGWGQPGDYINYRIGNAQGILAFFDDNSGAYIWRWGQYYFISLGLWAGSCGYESNTHISYSKLNWLKDFLAEHVGTTGLGVLIFQHYGWDYESTNGHWWTPEMRDLELDVLCRRDWNDTTYQAAQPYNVLGIFTGHVHEEHHWRVFAGLDSQEDSVFFDNIIFNDAGADNSYGFAIVKLLGDTMVISTSNIIGGWSDWGKSYQLGTEFNQRN